LQHENEDPNVEVSLLLCDDPFIRSLNLQHRGIDKPTDVLSFTQESPHPDMPADRDQNRILGDVVISLETADAQARTVGWPIDHEVCLLAVHGVLHLLGYDDETVEGAATMRDKSAVVLKECGIPLPATMPHPYFIEYN
jgi:probable rRNA maturation factor